MKHSCAPRILRVVIGLLLQCGELIAADPLPSEPVEIGGDVQFVLDNYIVDNHWAIKYKKEAIERVFHEPSKCAGNPLIVPDGGYTSVLRDPKTGQFRMWYQTWVAAQEKGKSGQYAIAYAHSDDGLVWELPKLGLLEWKGTRQNNIVWKGLRGKRGSQVYLLELPEADRRGYRYVMLYGGHGGSHLIGSQDGIHWDRASDTVIASMHSDTQNTIVYDPRDKKYVMFCRAKHIYRTFRGTNFGHRRVATRGANGEQRVVGAVGDEAADDLDSRTRPTTQSGFTFFYGMPTRYLRGHLLGLLVAVQDELATSTPNWPGAGTACGFHRMPRPTEARSPAARTVHGTTAWSSAGPQLGRGR